MTAPEVMAEELLRTNAGPGLAELERSLTHTEAPLDEQIAVKLARSKLALDSLDERFHVSFVFAMYKETERILPPDRHPLGEDFINRKASQLRWLFDGDHGWDLVIVDDGCPDGSGRLAEEIISGSGLGSRARVLYLADAIEDGHPVVADLSSPDESRKGGAIQLGMHEAANRGLSRHVVAYTDADLSTNLSQAGLLVEPIANGGVCAAGSRREPTSVVVKGGARNDRGKFFIYIWKQMLPELGEIVDSQCGFKAFRADAVPSLVRDTIEKKFAFDIELLLRCRLEFSDPVSRVGIAWVDSEEASTTTDLEPYLPMLQAIARMYRRYSAPDPRAESFVELVEDMDQDDWKRMVAAIPPAIRDREPITFVEWAGVDADDLAGLIRSPDPH